MAWAKQNQHMTFRAWENGYAHKLEFITCHIMKPRVFSLVDSHDCVRGRCRKLHNNRTLPFLENMFDENGVGEQDQIMTFRTGENEQMSMPTSWSISMIAFRNIAEESTTKLYHSGKKK